ncbi:prepilin-type N-terminal cleavage/methylation domain-containing protein [Ligilactobacillus animalis]|uniref:prepilin-type N-terminal cleavage/methylation domain-containing protein n=1 Tax=Ligilactobacillus animalis TaxID=1605 RepID=UPI0027BE213B|nr:prepilin-type N-terminal cleavage/methylation domain-containing protein [Ligilactobacillus animalis]MDQ2234832.1 prepilin-type N-terminal cleavage/methylation domain-containing protein [Ligilactobacillus animalis]
MKKTKMKAFTLVEMAIVIFIISLLILIIIPNVAKQRSNAENVNTQALQAELDTQAQLYADEKGTAMENVAPTDLEKAGYLIAKQVAAIEKHHLKVEKKDQ